MNTVPEKLSDITDRKLDSRIVVLIPAYNEERFIGSVVLKTRQYVETVIVVDDGSTDATREIAEAAGAIVIPHHDNQGKGKALNTGFRKVLDFDPIVVVTLDGDWQHMPEQIKHVAEPVMRGEADVVVGSRYLQSESNVPIARIIGHFGFTTATNLLSGVELTDSQSGYRAFSPKAVSKLIFSSSSFSVESEMQFLMKDQGLKVIEVPIIIRYDDSPKRNVVSHGLIVMNGLLALVARHRPLMFFGGAGLICIVLGIISTAFTLYGFTTNGVLPIGTSLLVVLFFVMGGFLLLTAIVLWALRSWMESLQAILERKS